jgi:hypothetical protein
MKVGGGGAEPITGAATLAWEDPGDPWLEEVEDAVDAVEMTGMGHNLASVAASTM